MTGKRVPSEEGGIDWRRLAADRNVSSDVARMLWEHARATSAGDPASAERAFHGMLEEAEEANATHEPGRETLVGSSAGARDAASLGAGKWTRVLLEDQRPSAPVRRAPRPAGRDAKDGKPPSADELRDKIAAAALASKTAAALLATSDPATIIAALLELRQTADPGLMQKIMSAAGGAIERILTQRPAEATAAPAPDGEPLATTAPTASATAAEPPAANAPAASAPAATAPVTTTPATTAPATAAPAAPAPKPAPTTAANRAGAAKTREAAAKAASANMPVRPQASRPAAKSAGSAKPTAKSTRSTRSSKR